MDACLFVGNPHTLVENLAALLQGKDTILIDPIQPSWKPTVWLPVTQVGVDATGSMARLDGVPLLLEKFVESGRRTIQTLLVGLLEGRVPS
jgi:formylmethanofuran dehydrogenase subunit B